MTETVRIGFTGDVMLGRIVDRYHRDRPPDAVWGSLLDRLHELDGLFINLECCLSKRKTPWNRTYRPFHFRADPDWAIPALEAAAVDCCALANNHVLDFEVGALEDTLDVLDDAEIAHAGAGRTLDRALEPAFAHIAECSIAFVSFTDNTPEYAAAETTPGTAHIEIDNDDERSRERVSDALRRAEETSPDLLIASLHWGPNMVTEPRPEFEAFGRWLIDEGVDIVHGHSAHVFHGIEVYDGSVICYDTGDFVDDYAVDDELRNDLSFLFEFRLQTDGTLDELRLLPTQISDCAVHEADRETARWSRKRMQTLSQPYGTDFSRDGSELVLSL